MPERRSRRPTTVRNWASGRLTIRFKLTVAFVAAMSVVLAATGLFLFLRFRGELNHTIDRGLRSQVYGIEALIRQADSGLRDAGRGLIRNGQSFAQVIVAGRVKDWTPPLSRHPLLTPAELTRTRRSPLTLNKASLPAVHDSARLLAVTVSGQDRQPTAIVVGALLADRDQALSVLALLLVLGGTGALVLAGAVGYALSTAALRTVESMRRRAQTLSVADPGERLPVPQAHDELRRLGITLNEMLVRNEAAFARERAFVDDASHELRTPLAILRAELEIALRGEGSLRELRAALTSAAQESERLSQLVDDLLLIARADHGTLEVRRRPMLLTELLERVTERFRAQAVLAGQALAVLSAPDLRLLADPARLEQALANLVDNSLRHGEGPVFLSCTRTEGRVELHVTDEGPGFPPGFLDTAFERFARADGARSADGSGLGLAIARSIAHAHRGEAHVANRASGGADTWLTLPVL